MADEPVQPTQIAPTLLQALRLDPHELGAVLDRGHLEPGQAWPQSPRWPETLETATEVATGSRQGRQGCLGQVEEPVHVGRPHGLPGRVVQLGERARHVPGRVADQHVQPPEAGQHLGDQLPHLPPVADVGHQGQRPVGIGAGQRLVELGPAAAGDHHRRTGREERPGDGQADAGTPAGHQHDRTGEVEARARRATHPASRSHPRRPPSGDR
jgi:hypothetical protein